MDNKSYIQKNEEVWDKRSDNNDIWSLPVTSEEIGDARRGKWEIKLTPKKTVPREWFPQEIKGKKVLCLASGGGQQGPIIAASGAEVTVFDNSNSQLQKDRYVAERDNLLIKTVQGNMQDLSVFEDEIFDIIIHPWSNNYINDVLPVWKECARILKKEGILLAGFGSPLEFIFDLSKFEQGKLELKYSIPYADMDHLDDEKVKSVTEEDGLCWGHSLEDQIQGQISSGFAIEGFYEDGGCAMFDDYMNTSMATKAVKRK